MNNNVNTRRKSDRLIYDVNIQCLKCISEGNIKEYESPLEIQVANISNEGLCIFTAEVFKEGVVLEFDIVLEDKLYKFISGIIVWSIMNKNRNEYGLHINTINGKFVTHIDMIESRLSVII